MGDERATQAELRGSALWITLNRPQARNALSADLVASLLGDLSAAQSDPRMGDVYKHLIRSWTKNSDGGTFGNFALANPYSQYWDWAYLYLPIAIHSSKPCSSHFF